MKSFTSLLHWLAIAGLATFLFNSQAVAEDPGTNPFPVTIGVDASKPSGELPPIWRFFGADEPNYAYMKDGEKLLEELGQLGVPQVFFRCHHLLTSGDGSYALKWGSTSAYKETAEGKPVYDWSINDRIFDTYLKHNIKPYVQIGFMPEALSTHPENYPHNPPIGKMTDVKGGQSYPPKDYVKWGDLVFEWVKHCIARYGIKEVRQWYWEVWNEPNISYWHGTREEYFQLYDYAVAGVRRAIPDARVGGPETAGGPGGTFLADFLKHCSHGTNYATRSKGSPLDFISFHAKGSPVFTNGHVRMSMSNQLKNISDSFAVISKFPEYHKLPIVIGESDPEGCAACREPRDAYRNGTMYSSYTAASFPRKLQLAREKGANLMGALTWAFEFEDQPPFAGFRQLSSAGIDLPVLNVFRMFAKMNGNILAINNSNPLDAATIIKKNVRGQPDVSALAVLNKKQLAVLVWHYHDDDVAGPDAAINLVIKHLPSKHGKATLTHYRVDASHSNAYEVWKKMGSPTELSADQRQILEASGKLAELEPEQSLDINKNSATLHFNLPRQGVSLLLLNWK